MIAQKHHRFTAWLGGPEAVATEFGRVEVWGIRNSTGIDPCFSNDMVIFACLVFVKLTDDAEAKRDYREAVKVHGTAFLPWEE